MKTTRYEQRKRRKARVRARVSGTPMRPRLSVNRSLRHVRVQLIDDVNGVTIASASDADLQKETGKPVDIARAVGKVLAERAREKNIESVVFDRSGRLYHGRIQALAEGAREGGLNF